MRKAWEAVWKSPDATMLVAGGEGERQVANVRVVVALLMLTPLYRQFFEPFNLENVWGLAVTIAAMLFSFAVYFHLRRHVYRPWMGFLTSTFDGSFVTLARTLVAGVRESDVVVRFGGEEFVLLLHDTDAEAAFAKTDALRQVVERLVIGAPQHAIQFTLSAGIAVYPEDGSVAHVLLSRADQRLLQAKQDGRNRVVGGRDWAGIRPTGR